MLTTSDGRSDYFNDSASGMALASAETSLAVVAVSMPVVLAYSSTSQANVELNRYLQRLTGTGIH
jgi:hypothetical protein